MKAFPAEYGLDQPFSQAGVAELLRLLLTSLFYPSFRIRLSLADRASVGLLEAWADFEQEDAASLGL
jgi:hypothetical protein